MDKLLHNKKFDVQYKHAKWIRRTPYNYQQIKQKHNIYILPNLLAKQHL